MPDSFDSNGLRIASLSELREQLAQAFQMIYGPDINLDQNTPDGQLMNIFAQEGIDLRELLAAINSSFDPEQAQGRVLDQRVAINGVVRRGGTFTRTLVSISTDRAVSLKGLDDSSESLDLPAGVFIVRDDSGAQFVLEDSIDIPSASTRDLQFRAVSIGVVPVSPNTITEMVTIIAGVTVVNNPSSPLSIGVDEETDEELRERRRRSMARASVGFLDSIIAVLLSIDGVTSVSVMENVDDVADANGIPPHSIWAIVEGGDDLAIGQAIYETKSAGAGMKGETSVSVPRPDGTAYPVKFDRPTNTPLYIRFTITGPGAVDREYVKARIVQNVMWDMGQAASTDTIISFVKGLYPTVLIIDAGISTDGTSWQEVILASSPSQRFVNSVDRITIG